MDKKDRFQTKKRCLLTVFDKIKLSSEKILFYSKNGMRFNKNVEKIEKKAVFLPKRLFKKASQTI